LVNDISYFSKVLKKLIFFIITLIAIFLCLKLAIFYIPFLIGFIISLLIEPLIKFIKKKTGLTRKVSSIMVLMLIFAIIIGLIIWGSFSLITETTNLLQGLNVYIEKIYSIFNNLINNIKFKIPEEVFVIITNSTENILNLVTNYISNYLSKILQGITLVPIIGIYVIITILSTYFICSDKIYILDQLEHHFPKKWFKKFVVKLNKIIYVLGNYLKAEATIIFISFIEVLLGLYIFKWSGLNIEYPLLAAIGIAFVDALPILGSGTVMLPWAIWAGVNGDIKFAIAMIILYIIVLIVRQILEPKIVSNKIGVHPIFTLIAMYTGFRVSGIIGLFIGPIILIILTNVFENLIDNGIVKSIFEKK